MKKFGKEGPSFSDFGELLVKFIGILIVKIVIYICLRGAYRYVSKFFPSKKDKKDKKKKSPSEESSDCDPVTEEPDGAKLSNRKKDGQTLKDRVNNLEALIESAIGNHPDCLKNHTIREIRSRIANMERKPATAGSDAGTKEDSNK